MALIPRARSKAELYDTVALKSPSTHRASSGGLFCMETYKRGDGPHTYTNCAGVVTCSSLLPVRAPFADPMGVLCAGMAGVGRVARSSHMVRTKYALLTAIH
eukprot:7894183-Pyramimonas_sp.AAC.2